MKGKSGRTQQGSRIESGQSNLNNSNHKGNRSKLALGKLKDGGGSSSMDYPRDRHESSYRESDRE